jgi:hypothetical protein
MLALVMAFSIGAFAVHAEDDGASKFDDAKARILRIVLDARRSERLKPAFLSSLYDAITNNPIRVETEPGEFPRCERRGEIGFHRYGTIYLCERLHRKPVAYIAQVILHENIHSLDVHDECETTRLELAVMDDSGWGRAMENSYVHRCGLD